MVMLYTPYIPGDVSIRDVEMHDQTHLKAWITNETLHISGLTNGEKFSVFNVLGIPVHYGVANSDVIKVKLNHRGIYFIRSGNNAAKIVY
jgi:hypothetical protein